MSKNQIARQSAQRLRLIRAKKTKDGESDCGDKIRRSNDFLILNQVGQHASRHAGSNDNPPVEVEKRK